MKKNLKFIFIAIILVMATSMLFVACDLKDSQGLKKLSTPKNLVFNGSALSWDSVVRAEKYFVAIGNGGEIETSTNSYDISGLDKGTYTIYVRAYGDGKKYGSSDKASIEYIQGERLKSPTITISYEDKRATWDNIDKAVGYKVGVKNKQGTIIVEEKIIEQPLFLFEQEAFNNPNIYTLSVTALADSSQLEVVDSKVSTAEYVVSKVLEPTKLTSVTSSSIRWEKVDNAEKYKLTMIDKNTEEEKEFFTTATSLTISSLGIKEAGVYTFKIQAIGDGKVYLDSAITEDTEEEFAITKLESLDLDTNLIEMKTDIDNMTYLTWIIPKSDADKFSNYGIKLVAYAPADKKDTLSDIIISISSKVEDEKKGYSIVEETIDGVDCYRYKLYLDSEFITKNTEKVEVDGVETDIIKYSYKHGQDYYGKLYSAVIYCTNGTEYKYIASEEANLEGKFESYKVPEYSKITNYEDYYSIKEAGHLAYISKKPDAKYILESDIDCLGYPMAMIDNFSGILNGQSQYTIKNLVIVGDSGDNSTAGFVGVNDGIITEINFVGINSYINNAEFVGLIGINNGTITNVFAQGSISCDYAIVGGIAGLNNGIITNTQASINVSGQIVGGLIGVNKSTHIVSNVVATGNVNASSPQYSESYVGGVELERFVENKENIIAGGLIGVSIGTQVNYANIIASSSIGRIQVDIGNNLGVQYFVLGGGFIGYSDYTNITLSYAGQMYSVDDSKITKITANGNNSMASGFVGYFYNGKINTSYTNILVNAPISAGFVVASDGEIYNSWTTKATAKSGDYYGFIKDNDGTIDNCYYLASYTKDGNNSTAQRQALTADWSSKLMNKLYNSISFEEDGSNETKVLGRISGEKDIVFVGRLYLRTYSEKIKKNADLTTIAYGVDKDDVQIIISGPKTSNNSDGYERIGEFDKNGTVIAKYKKDGLSNTFGYVLVNIN